MTDVLPFSAACERNKEPILAVLRDAFATRRRVLEIGSGTGQHAIHFAQHLPHLQWHPTERRENLAALQARLRGVACPNLLPPAVLDVSQPEWPLRGADAIFTANTLHIMSWQEVLALFAGIAAVLEECGVFAAYGPFRYGGRYTSPSNQDFDQRLRRQDPHAGLRDLDLLKPLAAGNGLALRADHDLPAHNRLLLWERAALSAG